jgi:phosphoglycerate dehydrogenase-like enzyme
MTQALYYKPTYERLRDKISAIAPELDVCLFDENGVITRGGKQVAIGDIAPEWFWIHGDLFKSTRVMMDYFKLMQESPSIKWLHTINTGLDHLPYLPLIDKGVLLTNNHAQAIAIAEYTLAQVLAHYQNIAAFRDKQKQKQWKPHGFREIHGSHWLVIGFGEIGQEVARRAKAFGARITAVRRKPDTAGLADAVITQQQLPGVLPTADVVVVGCTSNSSTRHMVNAAFLQAMKADSVLVNVARGDLVVEADLKVALDKGIPEVAILDVFEQEPLPMDHWAWTHPRVVVTPHASNAGNGMIMRAANTFLDNLARMTAGQTPHNIVSRGDIV